MGASTATGSTAAASMNGEKRPFQVKLKPISKPEIGHNGYAGFHPGKVEKLEAGYSRSGWDGLPGRPLTSAITVEHDVEIVMRDGARLYADIYRPTDSTEKIPFIVSWSPFGKKYNGHDFLPNVTWKAGVLAEEISGLEKFEGLDPALWCPAGYAIASVDTRGAGDSDGDMYIMGTQDAQDGYDVIEALANLPYCNGSVGMAGNSHLAISQYFIAAQNPPSLKAIAPWEGCGDLYREQFVRGGILHMSNFDMIIQWILRGKGGVEDFKAMYDEHPTVDDFWKDKRPDMTKIKIPAYIEGSDHSGLHTMGSVRAWLQIDTPHKWLRWSGWQEWHDLWAVPENQRELMQFFDRFLKGIDNDFEHTVPKVRMSVLRYGDQDPISNITYPDYPIPNTDYKEFFLAGDGKLSETPTTASGEVRYDSTDGASMVQFKHTFDKKTHLIGMSKLHVFVSSEEHDDMCVYVRIRKLDSEGQPMVNIPFPMERRHAKRVEDITKEDRTGFLLNMGPLGQLRASHRSIDRSKSMHSQYPFHPHDKVEKIPPGTVTELEIGIWQAAIEFEAGEGVRVDIFGSNVPYPELANLSTKESSPDDNKGHHIVHFGGEYPSRVILPLVPVENL